MLAKHLQASDLRLVGGPVLARMNALAKDPDQLFPDDHAGPIALPAFVQERLTSPYRDLNMLGGYRELQQLEQMSEVGRVKWLCG